MAIRGCLRFVQCRNEFAAVRILVLCLLTVPLLVRWSPADAAKMYWIDAHGINRANLDGSHRQVIIPKTQRNRIALDADGGKMYWTDSVGKKIQRANLDGTDIEDLVIQGTDEAQSFAIDPVARKVCWADDYRIQRANLDGTDYV